MKKYTPVLIMLVIIGSCNGQQKTKEEKNSSNKTVTKEDKKGNNPKVDIKVNKTYDAKGNIIRLDSAYTYYYSNKGKKDSAMIGLDTVFNRFKNFYSSRMSPMMNRSFENMFLNDTLFRYDFLNEDFFRKRFELNDRLMGDMLRQMDSLKTAFLKETRKGIPETKAIKK
jgi:hypothetical protein